MLKKTTFSLILSLFFVALFAEHKQTVIKGKHPDYKNTVLSVSAYADYISSEMHQLGIDTVDAEGNFEIHINLNETQQIFLDLGLFEGVLYLQPGDNFDIVLPDYSPKTMGEILNPFFQPTQIYLGIKNMQADNLNLRIADFDQEYNQFIEDNYIALFKKPRQREMDSLLSQMELSYDSIAHNYFKNYRTYKYAWLQYVSYKRDYRYIIRDFYNDKPPLYFNLAYMDLFNQLFTNYFTFYQNTSEGERLYSDIAYAKSPKYIAETFENNMVLTNDTLQELVMLKGIHDAYYAYDFPLSSLGITLDSIAELTQVSYHKAIAEHIKKKVLKVKTGQPIPPFALLNSEGIIQENTAFDSSYVYLMFCSVESFTCQQDFNLIKAMLEKHPKAFKVISISIDEDFEMAKEHFTRNNYNWTLMSYGDNKDMLEDYKVRAYPTYYLIDRNGRFKMSPAPSPSENFEYQFFKMLETKKRGTR